jgi:hypothetical protein
LTAALPSTSPQARHRAAPMAIRASCSAAQVLRSSRRISVNVPDTALEFRGEFADVLFVNPANLRANHLPLTPIFGPILGSNWEAVPFYRYTYQNFQTGGFAGTNSTGSGQMQFHDVGVAVYPTPELALKLNYTKALNAAPSGAQSDSVLGGVGFFF